MSQEESSPKKFGTFTGIFVPNVTMMFGVILFLRLSLILGNVGIGQFMTIIAISFVMMMITSLSIGMIVTNMRVGSGGIYYLISRSLGIEIGGAIGIALVISQLISLSLCVSAFAYSLTSLVPYFSVIQLEVLTLLLLALLSSLSANLALRIQVVVFFFLLITIGTFFFSEKSYLDLASPYYASKLTFWSGFALFYPALTGIEAGMALSSNLKNPSRSLLWGNIWSLVLVSVVYLSVGLFLYSNYPTTLLQSDPLLIISQSKFPFLIYLGIWCATLSSVLTNFLGAPRMLQMIAEDRIVPSIFSRTYGAHKEPRWSIAFIFIVALLLLLFTTIDQILPILTMICLLTYGTLNLVAGLSELIHSPSWRPTFRAPWKLCLFGACLALILMLMIDPLWTMIAIISVGAIFLYLRSRSLEVDFRDIRESIMFYFFRMALYKLYDVGEHSSNWLPQIIVFSRSPTHHEKMLRLAYSMTQRSGILTIASILPELWEDPEQVERTKNIIRDWLEKQAITSLLEVQAWGNYFDGIDHLIKNYGIGPLQPNTLMFSLGENTDEKIDELVLIHQTAQLHKKNVMLFFDAPEAPLKLFIKQYYRPKIIDLWWTNDHRASFELSLSFILALRTSPVWNQRLVNLRIIASDERAKDHLQDYFQTFFKNIRIKAKIKIAIEEQSSEPMVFFQKYSDKADLVFIPILPIHEFDDQEKFRTYLKKILLEPPISTTFIAITSYDEIDHKEIYS